MKTVITILVTAIIAASVWAPSATVPHQFSISAVGEIDSENQNMAIEESDPVYEPKSGEELKAYLHSDELRSRLTKIHDVVSEFMTDEMIWKLKKNDKELFCLAENIWWEGRGKDFLGKIILAQVVNNRTDDTNYANTNCGVVHQAKLDEVGKPIPGKCQFSWVCDGHAKSINLKNANGSLNSIKLEAWKDSIRAALTVKYNMIEDLTDGATHFYNPKVAKSSRHKWIRSAKFERTIEYGGHVFARSNEVSRTS